MLSCPGGHTLEGQRCLARVRNPLARLPAVPASSGTERGKEGAPWGQGPKGPEKAKGHAPQPWPGTLSLGLGVCLAGSQDAAPGVKVLKGKSH